ncbi:MAG: Sir2 family NAD-dependent protein deacetylase [Brachybacterium sp.]|nr:Sir2 family NAD-dependent protein deacetylase [Brachybacterium sp.]
MNSAYRDGEGDRTGRAGPAADVGRWFSTAARPPSDHRRGLPRMPAWGPTPGDTFGHRSPPEVRDAALAAIRGRPTTILTGAGVSTASGLPDYRGQDAVPRTPMTYQEFTGSDLARRRYWARSTVGWTQFSQAAPNIGHLRIAELADRLPITGVITQNVDGLHQEAGSAPVIDLHGRLDRVRCLGCESLVGREQHQQRMLAMNPGFAEQLPQLAADAAQAPDGDAEVDRTSSFRYPGCGLCGGILKPDVVFFGESARRALVAESFALLEQSRALLVIGSSLTVMSGFRFVRRALADGRQVVILNDGPTRGDAIATHRVHGRLEEVLGAWIQTLDEA